jgi:very-short-patch-repair endonuclease
VIERRVQSGRLLRVHRGVYQTGAVAGAYARAMAAVLACGGECRVSHRSAAVLLEPRPWGDSVEPVEVTMQRRNRRRISGIRVHLTRDLAPDEVTTVQGIPVTTPTRTLLDLGECLGFRELEQALALAERNGQVAREEVRAMVRRHPRHRGARVLRRILDDDLPAAFTRSRAEEIMLALIRKAHLPAPELNARLLQYGVDFLWRGQRLVVEVDGMAYHGSAWAFVEDRRRDAALMAAGYRVLRVTWPDLTREPEAMLVRLAQALSR